MTNNLSFVSQGSGESTTNTIRKILKREDPYLFYSDDEEYMSTSLPLSFLESKVNGSNRNGSGSGRDISRFIEEDYDDDLDELSHDKPKRKRGGGRGRNVNNNGNTRGGGNTRRRSKHEDDDDDDDGDDDDNNTDSMDDDNASYLSDGGDSQDPDIEFEWRKLTSEERVDETKPKFMKRVLSAEENVCMDNPLVDSFCKIFSDEIIQFIVDRTNIYAIEKVEKGYEKYLKTLPADTEEKKLTLEEWPRRKWRPLTIPEFKSFLGCLMLMGIIQKPKIGDYWEQDRLTVTPSYTNIMGRHRFWHILSFLHFSTTKPFSKGYIYNPEEPLAKITEICDRFVLNFRKYYSLEQEIAIDESMCVYKGILGFKQYCPRKHHRWGIKFFSLACARSGYIYNTIPYSGKSTSGSSNDIIKVLVKDLENRGHHVFMDNYFSSFRTLNDLEKLGFGVTATIRLIRKGLPNEVRKITKKDLKFDESVFYVFDNYLLALWKDTRIVSAISNVYGTDFEDRTKYDRGSRRNVKLMRPRLIAEYSRYMHGVDRADQLLSYYDFSRRSQQWWKKVFYYLIQVSICNAYILYSKAMKAHGRKPRSTRDFRLDIIEYLLSDNRKYQTYKNNPTMKISSPGKVVIQTNRMHLIEVSKEKKQRRCVFCKKSRSQHICGTCQVNLCIDCFRAYHVDYKP